MKDYLYIIIMFFCLFMGSIYLSKGIERFKRNNISKWKCIIAIISGICYIILCFIFFVFGMFNI